MGAIVRGGHVGVSRSRLDISESRRSRTLVEVSGKLVRATLDNEKLAMYLRQPNGVVVSCHFKRGAQGAKLFYCLRGGEAVSVIGYPQSQGAAVSATDVTLHGIEEYEWAERVQEADVRLREDAFG